MSKFGDELIGGKTFGEWETKWEAVNGGFKVLQSDLRDKVGLYRAKLNGNVVAIGKGVELRNGGLRKRLGDFRRDSPSGRNHWIGQYIHQNRGRLDAEVLITGSDREAVCIANALKKLMIEFHKPDENVPEEIIQAKIAAQKERK